MWSVASKARQFLTLWPSAFHSHSTQSYFLERQFARPFTWQEMKLVSNLAKRKQTDSRYWYLKGSSSTRQSIAPLVGLSRRASSTVVATISSSSSCARKSRTLSHVRLSSSNLSSSCKTCTNLCTTEACLALARHTSSDKYCTTCATVSTFLLESCTSHLTTSRAHLSSLSQWETEQSSSTNWMRKSASKLGSPSVLRHRSRTSSSTYLRTKHCLGMSYWRPSTTQRARTKDSC